MWGVAPPPRCCCPWWLPAVGASGCAGPSLLSPSAVWRLHSLCSTAEIHITGLWLYMEGDQGTKSPCSRPPFLQKKPATKAIVGREGPMA